MAGKTTRKASRGSHGLKTTTRNKLPSSAFAFPKERKEPLTSKSHVRNALARFDQTEGVTASERKQAFQRIKRAAHKYGLNVEESNWHELGKSPHTTNRAHKKKS